MGLLIGIPAGILHVFLLSEFTGGLVKTGKPPLLYGLGVALLPPLVLIPVALLWREVIAWVGIGMAVVLIAGGIFAFVRLPANQAQADSNNREGGEES